VSTPPPPTCHCTFGLSLILLAASLCQAQGFSPSGAAWPQMHFSPAHTGFNPSETVLNPKTVGHLVRDWTLTTGGVINGGVAEANGLVYFGNQAFTFYAVEAATGAVKWQFTTAGYVYTSPAVVDGLVYVSSAGYYFADLYALNAQTGAQVWDFHISNTAGYLTDPVVAGGIVYVAAATSGSQLYAVNARSGAMIWTRSLPRFVEHAPALSDNVLYAGSFDGNLYALNAATGAVDWTFAAGGNVVGIYGPAVADGTVYVSGASGKSNTLYALSSKTKRVLWRFTVVNNRTIGFTDPVVAYGTVYINGGDGGQGIAAYALDANNGKMLWKHSLTCCVFDTAAVADGVLYFSSNETVVALDAASGKKLWQSRSAFDPVVASPTVINGRLFSGSSDSNLYAYHLAPSEKNRSIR